MRRSGSRHLLPGLALDIIAVDPDDGKPLDFQDNSQREKARDIIRRQGPYIWIGSPMCTAFSTWQRLNKERSKDAAAMRRALAQATVRMKLVISLYDEQVLAGRYFLHEHPRHASSWGIPGV